MSNKKDFNKIANLLNKFKDKPNLLAKFLIDNNALNQDFINSISINMEQELVQFKDIDSMNEYYNSLLLGNKDIEDLTIKLLILIESERFEEAAKVRDMIKKLK